MTIVVATFGSDHWRALGDRAAAGAAALAPVVRVHDETLATARNRGLDQVGSEFVIHLDADDELEPGYIEAMSAGSADLRAPAVRYVRGRRAHVPYVPKVAGHQHACTADCLDDGNWLVIGTLARTELLRSVGGWREWPCYEDWCAWRRCWKAGASIEAIPDAIYRAHVRPDSRNRAPAMSEKNRVHHEILAAA